MSLLANSFSAIFDISSDAQILYLLCCLLFMPFFSFHSRYTNMAQPLPSPRFLIYTIAVHVLDNALSSDAIAGFEVIAVLDK